MTNRRLKNERTSADDRLQRGMDRAMKVEQRSEAASVEVLSYGVPPNVLGITHDPRDPNYSPVIIVMNHGKYAITGLDVRLSPDGSSVIQLGARKNLLNTINVPTAWIQDARAGVQLGTVYLGTIPAGQAMRLEGNPLVLSRLRTSFPLVRWMDAWGTCWEYNKGEIRIIPSLNEIWRPSG